MLHYILLAIVILFGIMLLGLMVVGWMRRRRKHADLAPIMPTPALPAGATQHGGTYVATTVAGDPYDRIAAGGLGFRGVASAAVYPTGVLVRRTGEVELWIPRVDLIDAGRATWTIDRVVEPGGLTMLRWRLGAREVDTYLRLHDPVAFDRDLAALIPVSGSITKGSA
jgi:hypothetical protein